MDIIKLNRSHSRGIAKLHIEGIRTGFISSLGQEFVTALYEAVAEDKNMVIRLHRMQLRNREATPRKINKLLSEFEFAPLKKVLDVSFDRGGVINKMGGLI